MLRSLASLILICLAGAAEPSRRVLVIPFENTRQEPRLQWLSEAASVLVSDGYQAGGIEAISRGERLRAFDELHLPSLVPLTRATVIKVGQLVNATEVVVGSFEVADSTLSIAAHVIRLDAG